MAELPKSWFWRTRVAVAVAVPGLENRNPRPSCAMHSASRPPSPATRNRVAEPLPAAKIEQVLTKVTQPPKGRRRWSVRTMAKAAGISPDSVHRLWKQNDLKPHLTRTFKLSSDPQFETKFWDVIGLYLNPPDKALVLCCDEKSQCQALERTQPGLPLGMGHIRTQTARLLPAWDDYPLCSAELSGWQDHLPH